MGREFQEVGHKKGSISRVEEQEALPKICWITVL